MNESHFIYRQQQLLVIHEVQYGQMASSIMKLIIMHLIIIIKA